MHAQLDQLSDLLDRAQYPWATTLLFAAGAVIAISALHWAFSLAVVRLARGSALTSKIVEATARPISLAWPLAGLDLVWRLAADDLRFIGPVRHVNTLLLIIALTWAASNAVRATAEKVLHDNAPGRDMWTMRRVQTQARVFSRTVVLLVWLLGVSAALMSFPSVRQIGTSILASAGVAGVVVGLAARPVLSNLLAGIQIAITQPIRIDDAVVVEGEWGWIEEITGTYVTVRIWDERRLVVPLNYFMEHPFQNWTRNSSTLTGSVFWWVDYRMPIEPLRRELKRLCEAAPEWDGRAQLIQVTDVSERAIQLRALVTAEDSPKSWDLRCRIREGIIDFIQREYPQFLPHVRNEIGHGAAFAQPAERRSAKNASSLSPAGL